MIYRSMHQILIGFIALCLGSVVWATEVPKNLPIFGEQILAGIGKSNTDIITAVRAQNKILVSLSEIKQRDQVWRKESDINPFMWNLMHNDCAFALAKLEYTYRFIVESFVMDKQGALVCLSHKTSDYWQGDEAKFTESYKNGQGSLHYGEVEYDSSSDEIMVQISVPVMSGAQAIGAITFGISLDRWERR